MNKTSIEWTHRPETRGAAGGMTWNPIRARLKRHDTLAALWEGRAQAMDRMGKKKSGAVLDGREWREFPTVETREAVTA